MDWDVFQFQFVYPWCSVGRVEEWLNVRLVGFLFFSVFFLSINLDLSSVRKLRK